MARIRSLKPGFCTSEAIAALSIPCRLHFAMLWTHADDHGKGFDNPRLIKAALWPLDDDVTVAVIESWQAELADHGRLIRYEVGGRRCFQIVNWDEHQHPQKPQDSDVPDPPDTVRVPVRDEYANGSTQSPPEGCRNGSHPNTQAEPIPVREQYATDPVPVSPVVVVGVVEVEEQEQEQEGARPARTAEQRTARLNDAVELLLQRDGSIDKAATKDAPARWLTAARNGRRSDHHPAAMLLLNSDPTLTPDQLADLLEPPTNGQRPPPAPTTETGITCERCLCDTGRLGSYEVDGIDIACDHDDDEAFLA